MIIYRLTEWGNKILISSETVLKLKLTLVFMIAFFLQVQAGGYSEPVSINNRNATLEQTPDNLFAELPLSYEIVGKTVAIKEKEKENIPLVEAVAPITITGKVTTKDGKPLPGVTVVIKGTIKGAITDSDGSFTLQATTDDKVLIFSSIGMKKQEIEIKGRSKVDVVMEEEAAALQEVVVTGYQTLPRERATGAFSYVGSKELEKTSSLNLKDKLEFLIPGLYFEPNYDEDQAPSEERSRSIVIRGVSTFGDNNPLIVVDGFPVNTGASDPWSTINPDDIESVTVLKDAAAASIWGAQAANGVIVIVTKKGLAQKPSLDVSIDYMAQPVPNLSKIPWATSKEAVDIYKWMVLDHNWFDQLLNEPYYSKTYDLPEVMRTVIDIKKGVLTQAEGDAKLAGLAKLDVRDEFANLFFRRQESNKRINISFQNAGDFNKVRTSVTATLNDKYARGNSDFNVMLNANDEYTPAKWLKFSLGTNVVISNKTSNGAVLNDLNYIPQMSRIMDENGAYLPMIKNDGNETFYSIATTKNRRDSAAKYKLPYDWDWNLKRETDNRDNTDKSVDMRLNTGIILTLIKGVRLETSYQYQAVNSLHHEYYNEQTWTVRNSVNNNAGTDGSLPIPTGGMLYENRLSSSSHDGRMQLSVDKQFGDHYIRALAGTEIRKDFFDQIPYGYYGYDPQSLTFSTALNFKDPITTKRSGVSTYWSNIYYVPGQYYTTILAKDDRFVSYYSNAGYTYKDKYDLTGSIRLDKTNLYGQSPSYRNLPQWSLGFGWTIDKEPFFKEAKKYVDYLRFRFSYGWNGNIDKSASPYIYGYPWTDPVTRLPYAAVQSAPNPSLTWEKTAVYNYGLDFALFKNKVMVNMNLYSKRTKDVLAQTAVNGTYGFQNNRATLNAGNINNNGLEVNVSALVIDRPVRWQSTLNYSTNRNMVRNIKGVAGTWTSYLAMPYYYHLPNQPVSYIAALRWAGYDETGLPQFRYGKNTVYSVRNAPGYSTMNRDSIIQFVGQRDPKHFGSWTNAVSYKRFEFSFRLAYKFGHKFVKDYPASGMLSSFITYSKYFTFLPELMVDRWTSPGNASSASMYSLNEKITTSNVVTLADYVSHYSTESILDASAIYLQNVSLAYILPSKWASMMKLRVAQIRLEARTLGPIWTANKEGINPDNPAYSSSTWGALNYVARNRPEFSLSLKLGF